jgi:uncharacterized membrane protein YdjX (TVP38/TMEM64 family)
MFLSILNSIALRGLVLDSLYIFLYELVCTIYPAPIEAPMFLFPNRSRITVLLAAAVGKGLGSYLMFISGGRFGQSRLFNYITELRYIRPAWKRIKEWTDNIMNSYGLMGFVVCQSVPGLPMRTAIYSVSILKINPWQYAIGSGIGTIVRCLIVYGSYKGLRNILALLHLQY